MQQTKKWYRFTGLPITYWGQATEEQAKAYCAIRAKRYPDATYTEVDDPGEECRSVINVDAWLPPARSRRLRARRP
jgi:hypothetical protein